MSFYRNIDQNEQMNVDEQSQHASNSQHDLPFNEQNQQQQDQNNQQPMNQGVGIQVKEQNNPHEDQMMIDAGNKDQLNQESVPIQKKQIDEEMQLRQQQENKENQLKIAKKLILQIKTGCQKDICFNKFCIKNKFETKIQNFTNDRDRLIFALENAGKSKDPSELICSESISINANTLDNMDDKQLKEFIEDGYAFASSFVVPKYEDIQMEDQSAFSDPATHHHSKKNPIIYYEIDYDGVEKLFKRLEKAFESEEELIKAFETLTQLLQHEYNQSPTIEKALMVYRSTLMFLVSDKLSWEWKNLFEGLISTVVPAVQKFRKESQIFEEFVIHNISKPRLTLMLQNIQSYFTISITSGTFSPRMIEDCIRFTDIFNDANNKRTLLNKLNYKEFYNDAVNKEISLKDHIIMWIQEREKFRVNRQPYDRHRVFTICNFPWILDSANKSEMLKIQNKINQEHQQRENIMDLLRIPGMASLYLIIEVRRDNILEDTLNKIVNPGLNFKKPLRIMFTGEPGIDEGGVKKEFFQLLNKSLFDPNYAMFNYNENERLYWFNGHSMEANVNFELVGILMGLAIYNNVILDLPFPMAAYKQLLFQDITFDDLKEWQPEIAQSFDFILNYNDPNVSLEEALGLNFVVQEERYGEQFENELKPGGQDIMVTEENRYEYVQLQINYIFSKQCEGQLRSFRKGFYRVCDEDLMTLLFKPEELEQLVCGSKKLDFVALQKSCRYVDGYTAESPQCNWLWEIVHEMTVDEQKRFLAFCTGSDRAPILGLGSVKIYLGRQGEDSERLPSAHTCFNHLLIPEYPDKEKLKQKLLLAISNSEGFGLM